MPKLKPPLKNLTNSADKFPVNVLAIIIVGLTVTKREQNYNQLKPTHLLYWKIFTKTSVTE